MVAGWLAVAVVAGWGVAGQSSEMVALIMSSSVVSKVISVEGKETRSAIVNHNTHTITLNAQTINR